MKTCLKHLRLAGITASFFGMLSALPLQAADGTLTNSLGNPISWDDTTKWSGGTVADGVGATANLTLSVGQVTVRNMSFDTDRTLGIFNIEFNSAQARGPAWVFYSANNNATLTFDNNGSGAQINQTMGTATSNNTNSTFTVPIHLADNLRVSNTSGQALTFNGSITSSMAGTKTIRLNGANIVFAGAVADGSLGTVALHLETNTSVGIQSANTYSGGTKIENGATLNISSGIGSATGTGHITIDEGGVLRGVGGRVAPTGNNVYLNGTLRVSGNRPTETGVTFTVANGGGAVEVVFGVNSIITLLSSDSDKTIYQSITFDGVDLKLAGTLNLNISSAFVSGIQEGDAFQFFNFENDATVTGTFSSITGLDSSTGLTWDTSRFYTEGILIAAAIPEPSTYAGAIALVVLAFVIYRRRRS